MIVNIFKTDSKRYYKQRKKIKKEMFVYYKKYLVSKEIDLKHKVSYLFFMILS